MRKHETLLQLIVLLISFFLMGNRKSDAQWVQQYTGTQKELFDISFIDQNVAFAVGQKYLGGPICMRTLDGGQSWDSLTLPSPLDGLYAVHALDAGHVYVAGFANPLIPVLLVSPDLGATWQNITPDSAHWRLNDVQFVTPSRGIALDDDAQIHLTVDGGNTWTVDTVGQPMLFNYPYYPQHVCWTDSNTVYLGCWDGSFAYGGAVLKSSDGGVNWTVFDFPQSYSQVEAMDFVDSLHGFAFCSGATGTTPAEIFRTQDGGTTWDTLVFNIANESLSDIAFVSPDTGYGVSGSGYIYVTNDAGQSWSQTFAADTSLTGLEIHNGIAWACGSAGLALRNLLALQVSSLSSQPAFTVFPVPARDQLSVRFNSTSSEKVLLKLFDAEGRILWSQETPDQLVTIPLNNFENGLYFLEAKIGERLYHSHVMHLD